MDYYDIRDRIAFGPMTKAMDRYVRRGQLASKRKVIAYNREFQPDRPMGDRYRWVENAQAIEGLRFVGKVHDIAPKGEGNLPYWGRPHVDHSGWYSDSYQDETVWGEVYQLPARNGESVYVPAVCDPHNPGCACIDFRSSTEDLADVVRWADSMAETWAETEREYQAKESAKERIADIDTEVADLRQEIRDLAADARTHATSLDNGAICKLIRSSIKGMRDRIQKLHKKQNKLREDFWLAVPKEGRY